MSHKILVADDSQTIQKVISLASKDQDFDLIQCLSANELFENISEEIELVLLDFSLDDNKSGYELCREIRTKFPKIPVMALLGVFDSVDESEFKQSGFGERIVKPFETEKFINKCIVLLNEEPTALEEVDSSGIDSEEDITQSWSVESPDQEGSNLEDELDATAEHNLADFEEHEDATREIQIGKLDSELVGWGFDPDELAKKDVTTHFDEFPPVIGEEIPDEAPSEMSPSIDSIPVVEDTAGLKSELDDDFSDETQEINFSPDDVEDHTEQVDESDQFDENHFDVASDEEFESLKSELASELEDDPDDFWSHEDEVEPAREESEKLEIVDHRVDEPDSSDEINYTASEGDFKLNSLPDELVENIRNDLAPLVEKYVRDYCEKEVEKVIWEIVPDLAENIIKKELAALRKNVERSV